MPEKKPTHWLFRVALEASGKEFQMPDIEPGASYESIWAQATKLSGLTEMELVKHAAEHFDLGLANLDQIEKRAISLVPEKVARSYLVFPLDQDDRQLVIATCDPAHIEAEETLRFVSGRNLLFELAPPSALRNAIETNYRPDLAIETLLTNISETVVQTTQEKGPDARTSEEIAKGPVVKLTNLILAEALMARASDIHIEPRQGAGVVRFRVDGELRLYSQLPMSVLERVTSRIKVIGNLDITERMRPQDGRGRIRVKNKVLDIRISTVPSRKGEKTVIRILYPEETRNTKELGLPKAEVDRLSQMLSRRDSLLFVTGPTGSGKTTTLYAALRDLMREEVNIMTVEEPVECELEGITQIQVEPHRGVTFATALRAILRQDPDIILVGEVRDLETAQIAVQASQTGHLVLATLHTNNAVGVFSRLYDLGLSRRILSESVGGIVSQRLLRLVCSDCAVTLNDDKFSEEETRLAGLYGVAPVTRAIGCEKCAKTGYWGRRPVVESLIVTSELEHLIAQDTDSSVLREAAIRGGMQPIQKAACELVREGVTTLEEIERVFGDTHDQSPSEPRRETLVLIVDDDPLTRKIGRSALEKAGYRCSEAGDGVEALECLNDLDYDLMILDVNMPRMGGPEVLQRVRRSVRTAGLPVIVLTASDTPEMEVRLMDWGADDYIRKPAEPSRLVARVRAVLRRAGN